MKETPHVTIESERFGKLELTEDQLLHFDGLPGFPELARFAVMQHDRESPFGWLLSVDQPEIAFLVTDPRRFFPDYEPVLEVEHLRELRAGESDPLEMLTIGRIEEGVLSLNLAAPLIVNPRNRRGVQAILGRGRWTTHERVPRAGEIEPSPEG